MTPAAPPVAYAAPAPFAPLPADFVIAVRKRAKVARSVTVVGRRVGDDATADVMKTEGAPDADGHTLFPIDGITETITAVLLAEAVRRGEVRLDEPVAELRDADLHPPARGTAALTLADLATHRSGPPPLPLREAVQPYAGIDRTAFAKLVNEANPVREPGSTYAPSVLDFALLGTLLADRAATSFAGLARERVFVPLEMNESVADTGSDGRVIAGRSIDNRAAAPWRYDALSPAGGVRTTPIDLLRFAGAMFDGDNGPLALDLRLAATPRARAGDGMVGLGWHVEPSGAVWASGSSYGGASFIGILPQQHVAVVILSNVGLSFGNTSFDDIGLRLLAETARGRTP